MKIPDIAEYFSNIRDFLRFHLARFCPFLPVMGRAVNTAANTDT
jgi:hypothetical protein|nr:MAG TPA: hypothetical protein [Caudoviricetes sp.]